jgi:chemotaxis-related protein WspB
MLLITFQLGNDRYGIDAHQIEEVLPLVDFKKIPRASLGIVGVLNYHGKPIPVLDLVELATGERSQAVMATRIILVRYPMPGEESQLLALVAEHVTDTLRREAQDFRPAGVITAYAPYLGDVTPDKSTIVQEIKVRDLLPEGIRNCVFQDITYHP